MTQASMTLPEDIETPCERKEEMKEVTNNNRDWSIGGSEPPVCEREESSFSQETLIQNQWVKRTMAEELLSKGFSVESVERILNFNLSREQEV